MALAPLTPCPTPRCPQLTYGGPCPVHARQRERARGTQRQRGYTRRWEHAATAFRRRYPLCGQRAHGLTPVMSRCFDEGRVTVATLVDHVTPHRGDPVKFWDETNWQSLCSSCHGRKTVTEDGGFGR